MNETQAARLHTHLQSLAQRVGNLVHDYRGDENEPVRSLLLAIVGELDEAARMVVSGTSVEGRRDVGETTGAWLAGQAPHMERNQRHGLPR